ncbi:class I tRNA ligase family protein [Frankia sp. Cr1]|uniref:class I tRNA ligase family protein n=1 Tax=Frankia sp. Cr1 TaxID=3073931 RepID=UPI002AD55E25|nr:class I tRNA ligase family protein [Frankia sp. Cr1]
MTGRVVVISPAPTANGDLHLGHLAGPFLAADVYTRYSRAVGREALLGTGVQDTPTYVVTTAHRLGTTPAELVARSTRDVRATLAAMGIAVDGFTGVEERFIKVVRGFMERLHAAGKFRLETMMFPYSPRTGQYLVDGYVRGGCPICLADGCAGLCESCAHPIAAGDLINPRSTMYPDDPVQLRAAQVLVLPMEEYRGKIRDHFADQCSMMRPHMAQAVADMVSRPLPDFPVTYPISWGIPAPFPEVAGQVINPNAEPMAWSMYCSALSAERRGAVLAGDDELWLTGAGSSVVYFLGFDNIYPFAIAGTAMLLAHDGRYDLPARFLTNEFYELDNAKFSTSRGHAVWGRELAAEVPRDLIRFHLAATSPEFQRTDFSREALVRVTRSRLVEPWNRVAARVDEWVDRGPLAVSQRSRASAARIIERVTGSYELSRFSLNRAAETLAEQLSRLDRWAPGPADSGDFCHEVDMLLRCAAPILIDLARQALPDTLIPIAGPAATEIAPRRMPRLRERAQ